MNRRTLACCVLWLSCTALPAQHFLGVGTEPRQRTHAVWTGLSGHQSVALDYGQGKWRPEYDDYLKQVPAGPLQLGKGAVTTLSTDVELAFGAQKLPRGRWYVAARRDGEQWSLTLFAADRVDSSRYGTHAIFGTEPEVRVPVRVVREAEVVELFDAKLTGGQQNARTLELTLAFGPYRMRTEFAAAFDDRMPEGTPQFARTAEGKGTKTASGLVWEQLQAGTGDKAKAGDRVRIHYVIWLADGTMYESTHIRGDPAVLTSEMVEPGFAEGLQLMQPGSTFRLTAPPELAYGARGMGRVPPNATLVYTVTLLEILK